MTPITILYWFSGTATVSEKSEDENGEEDEYDEVCEDKISNIAGSLSCKNFLRSFAYQYCRHKYIRKNCCASHKIFCRRGRRARQFRQELQQVPSSEVTTSTSHKRRRYWKMQLYELETLMLKIKIPVIQVPIWCGLFQFFSVQEKWALFYLVLCFLRACCLGIIYHDVTTIVINKNCIASDILLSATMCSFGHATYKLIRIQIVLFGKCLTF